MEPNLIDKYITFKSNPDNDEKEDSLFCSTEGVTLDALRLAKEGCPSWGKLSLERRRLTYTNKIKDIDEAMFDKALAGDTKAAELLYRRFDGWSPKLAEQAAANNNFLSFSDIVKSLKNVQSVDAGV